MHRQTPLTAGFVAYTGGGARTLIDEINDGPMMQEMKGAMMAGEDQEKIESPQNYGFTSVVMPAKKGKDGMIEECAEGFMSFLGGNRTIPICTVMDDRRYRLKELKAGDVAVFDHLQHQLHFNKDGVFITGRTDKKMKFQLVKPPEDDQQSGGGKSVKALADGGSSSDSSSGSGGKKKGQKQRYDKDSKQHLEITEGKTDLVHDKTVNYKTPLHSFQPGDGAAARAGGPLVQIFGDKFTAGLGQFMKQVEAAPPIKPTHLTTKGYVDLIFAALGIPIPVLPPLPFPPLPPGVTLPPGITIPGIPTSTALPADTTPGPKLFELMEARIVALERRVAELEKQGRVAMPDIRLIQSPEAFPRYSIPIDWLLLSDGTLDDTEALASAVIVALGTDKLAGPSDILPNPDSTDRAGWWGDMDAEELFNGWPIGTKLWLLKRAKIVGPEDPEGATLTRVEDYISEAIQPFIKLRIATSFDVEAWRAGVNRVDAAVTIYRGPKEPVDLRFQVLWNEIERA